MKEEFVTYEIAKKLKELGFTEQCLAIYDDRERLNIKGIDDIDPWDEFDANAPLWQQAIEWLREEGVFIVGPFPITETYEIQDKYGKTIYMSIPTLEWAVKDSIKLINERLH